MSLLGKTKNVLKHILPPPVNTFNREVSRILDAVQKNERDSQKLQQQIRKQIVEQQKIFFSSLTQIQKQIADQSAKRQIDELNRQIKVLQNSVEQVKKQAADSNRHAAEAVWAQIFDLTISGSTWLKDKAFSPGRWAVGYPYLYVMYRVLNETHPKHILELGLGQSTRMISQYAAAFNDVEHIVVEHDPEWIKFFTNSYSLPVNTRIVKLEREMVPYKEAEKVRAFKRFKEIFEGKKFEFISIDAPFGGDMKQYSRIDVLRMMPDCLSKDYVIMIDDTNRSGEINTLKEMEQCLVRNNFAYKRGLYHGEKSCAILCSEHLGFFSSM